MRRFFLSLGSNLGDKQKNIEKAYDKIEERIGKIVSVSALHITHPQGFESEHLFVNSVCEVMSHASIEEVFAQIQCIEKEIGRTSKSVSGKYADRVIDIDILLIDHLIINEPHLIVPHPRFHLRDFVLSPFNEIAPEIIHPVFHKTIRQLKQELDKNTNSTVQFL